MSATTASAWLLRHRFAHMLLIGVAGAATIILLQAATALPKDVVTAAGITVMLFGTYPYRGAAVPAGWFIAERLMMGLAIVGLYRLLTL